MLATSLALVACCALPVLLASVGLAGAWMLEMQAFLGPYEPILLWLAVSLLSLRTLAWVWQLWRGCTTCARLPRRGRMTLIPLMLLISGGLTWPALHPG